MTTSVSHSSAKYRRRNLVESLMAGAIPYLGARKLRSRRAALSCAQDLAAWEKVCAFGRGRLLEEFHPCKLPRAYKDFLLVTNGLDVIWSVKLKARRVTPRVGRPLLLSTPLSGRVVPVGSMHIASIDSIVRLKLSSTGKAQDFRAAFVIDENKLIGTVAMVYREGAGGEKKKAAGGRGRGLVTYRFVTGNDRRPGLKNPAFFFGRRGTLPFYPTQRTSPSFGFRPRAGSGILYALRFPTTTAS
ncbi:MAG: hypothetical protein BJ554DRAFT_1460 [Olpidium bornovanus]|uniref:Uncharacterized protein n=1 Tax=Olpidium bornovanus TaxID=278681 RepID=A0A8H8A1E6_9FUNG|nr:MAG: hypothetical protein BJ554DRAFT_1460 [Olpidium bornovanus]